MYKIQNKNAFIFYILNIILTYEELNLEIDRLAYGLVSLGLLKGDRVGIWSPNRYEWLLTQFATARIGLILVNINPAYRLSELEYALNKVQCKAIISAESFKTSNYIEMLKELAPELKDCNAGHLKAERLPHLRHVISMGNGNESGLFTFSQILKFGTPVKTSDLDVISVNFNPNDR